MKYLLAPSILSADMTRLGEEVENVLAAGADMIHFDVMDNHYVPNLTFGPVVCDALHRRFPKAILDVHLMASPVDELIFRFAEAGAHRISIHKEATLHLERSLSLIREQGCKAGLALNPACPIEPVRWVEHALDFILVMTVNPGFGGQTLIAPVIEKIRALRTAYPHIPICVDGGVNASTIGELANAGANEFVAGSAVFSSTDYRATLTTLRQHLT